MARGMWNIRKSGAATEAPEPAATEPAVASVPAVIAPDPANRYLDLKVSIHRRSRNG